MYSAYDDLNKPLEKAVPPQLSDISLDDSDMVALRTRFDRQIIQGHPMFFEEKDEMDSIRWAEFQPAAKPYPRRESSVSRSNGISAFDEIAMIKKKYAKRSFQNAKANVKNDIHKWFLYPKPLPKHWKFEKDRRLYDESSEEYESEESLPDNKKGFYYSSFDDDNFHILMSSKETNALRNYSKVHYTGEYFDLGHYEKMFSKAIVIDKSEDSYDQLVSAIPKITQFSQDFRIVLKLLESGELRPVSTKRIEYLLNKFDLFQHLEGRSEILENKRVPHRDFYNTRKVDQNLLLSGCVSKRQLNEFIWDKLNLEPDRIVYMDDRGSDYSLRDIFSHGEGARSNEEASIGLKAVDDGFLEWYKVVYLPGFHLNNRNSKNDTIRHKMYYMIAKTFLEFDNFIDGQYLAEILIKYVIHNMEKSKYQMAQLSVDFQFIDNWWPNFSRWVTKWKLISYNIRWNVRLSRSYTKLFQSGQVKNFQDYLDLVFRPLLSSDSICDINLQFFLSTLCCFDVVVDNEDDYIWQSFSNPETTTPCEWTANGDNPPVAYYLYYIYEYLRVLNHQRMSRSQNSIILRSYCCALTNRVSQFVDGVNITEQLESLVCNLLLCQGGLLQAEPLWWSSPVILYAYYLFQIPVIVSPLSSVSPYQELTRNLITNSSEAMSRDVTVQSTRTYALNPFMSMHRMGLKVSLSCNSVLFNSSYTMEPIIEEYSVAASIYLLNSADLCELVRNSVISSGYEGWYKSHWLGVGLQHSPFFAEIIACTDVWFDTEANTSERHNVPPTRRIYRQDTLSREWRFIHDKP